MSLPSRTSVWAAAARAIGAREPDPTVRNPDWLAEQLIGPDELAALGEHSLVIMGAGFDSRAYRFAPILDHVNVFEVDRPDTQQAKIRRVKEIVGAAPPNLTYVPVDFREQTFGERLLAAGYQPDQKTFFIWEGVTMYLPGDAVRDTLRWIAAHAPTGSSIVFDYTYEGLIRMIESIDPDNLPEAARKGYERFKQLTANEPWLFGLPDRNEAEFLRDVGLELRKVMGVNSAESVERYLTRADGTVFGSIPVTGQQGYLMLEAAVP